jgi:small-conductance mechanosensitive channel
MLVKYLLDEHVNVTGQLLIFVEHTLQKVFILLLAGLVIWELMKGRIRLKIKEEVSEEESFGEEMGVGGSRTETALLLLRKFFMAVVIVIACLLLLASMGINIGPLLAGAGVIGLAIGFGAQTLVKDIISGIFFLLDDAFRVGDYIETGGMRGTVEHISVRSLRLRHHRGPLITVPFGDMQSVKNYSRDYIVMKLAFRVRYDTNVEKVRKIVKNINKEIQKDKELGRGLLGKIKSQGVREMDDSAMIMRVKFTSVPGEQFVLRRVVYMRIQEAFQKEGIEFAHRNVTVYFPPEPSTTESESQGHEKEAESKTPDQKKKEAAAAAALRAIEEEQMPEDKPDEP